VEDVMNDQELVAELLERIAELAAVGADTLQDVPGFTLTVSWLTEAATGFTMAAQDGTLSRVKLADEDRERIEVALGEREPFLGDGEWPG
jgi:hypothetical protein